MKELKMMSEIIEFNEFRCIAENVTQFEDGGSVKMTSANSGFDWITFERIFKK